MYFSQPIDRIITVWKGNPSIRFLTGVLVTFFFWNMLYYEWFIDSVPSRWFTDHLAATTAYLLRMAGYAASGEHSFVSVSGNPVLYIGNPCNGVDFFGLFACFVLLFPVAFRHKWWFICVGIICIHVLNIIRLFLLAFIYMNYPRHFDFNHKYTFVAVIYGLMFFLWYAWAKKYRNESDHAA